MSENPDGWIEHDGGPCPVHGNAWVCVKYRDGAFDEKPSKASLFMAGCGKRGNPSLDWWQHQGHPDSNITAYRVVKP